MVPVRRLVDLLVDLEKIFSTDLEDVGIVRVLRFQRKTLFTCDDMIEIYLRKLAKSSYGFAGYSGFFHKESLNGGHQLGLYMTLL